MKLPWLYRFNRKNVIIYVKLQPFFLSKTEGKMQILMECGTCEITTQYSLKTPKLTTALLAVKVQVYIHFQIKSPAWYNVAKKQRKEKVKQ